ncbi:hypothetical protein Tco_0803347 [Tanacetum coccineum]|uniref:Uncharacterized protein n=1 Tax=Tanacetum coccineum TaxID=301880 RepID=A0ABQ5A1C0_9ASTR
MITKLKNLEELWSTSRYKNSCTGYPFEVKLKQLEASVVELSSKPSKIPEEKDEILAESLNRIRSLEFDLQKTKKALFATASKQMDTMAQEIHEKQGASNSARYGGSSSLSTNGYKGRSSSYGGSKIVGSVGGSREVKMTNNNELQNAKEVIDDLNRKVYYAEIEAKEHLERELASAREYDTCINVNDT